jgi:Arf-GAP/coiled-coil/ANK repeat/PH domain-containing protein
VTLGTAVAAAVGTRLEALVEGEAAAVVAAKARHERAKGACDAARADFLGLKKSAEPEARLRAARALDETRATARAERAALARAVAAAEAARSVVLLDAAADSAAAFVEYYAAASAAAAALPAALAALRARAATQRAAADAALAAANAAAAAHAAAAEPSAAAAEEAAIAAGGGAAGAGGAGMTQNLGRSHDADIRRMLAAGPGSVIKQGYLNKQARTWGWRRRFFVLDSAGTLTYYNEAQLVAAAAAKASAKSGSAGGAGGAGGKAGAAHEHAAAHAHAAAAAQGVALPPPPPVPPPGAAAHAAAPHAAPPPASSSSSAAGAADAPSKPGFGGKALNFLKNRAEAVANKMEAVAARLDGDAAAPGAGAGGGSSGASGASGAPVASGGEDDDDEERFASRTVNLHVSTVKLDGDPNDRASRDARFCLRLVSPGGSLVLQAESGAERDAWVATLQGVIAELITMGGAPGGHGGMGGRVGASAASPGLNVAAAVAAGPGNAACADCGAPDPDWASLNAVVALCQHCAGAHRGLGTHVSKVRSIALDADSWAPPIIALFATIGNAGAAAAWESGRPSGAPPVVPPGADAEARATAIRAKYAQRAGVAPDTLAAAAGEAGAAAAAAAADACDARALLAALAAGAASCGAGALHAAARRGDAGAQCAALLLLNGADPLAVDADGATPVDAAAAAGAPADGPLASLLRAAAAKAQA